MRPYMTSLLGELAEALGDLRKELRNLNLESVRKSIYQEILENGLEKGAVLSIEEINEIFEKYKIK